MTSTLRSLLVALLLGSFASSGVSQESAINPRIGDLIFREDQEPLSVWIVNLQGARFSHVGIVVATEPLRVLHALPNRGVVSESLPEFVRGAILLGIARPRALKLSQQNRLADASSTFLNMPFDLSMRMSTPRRVYCTELVLRLSEAAGGRLRPEVTKVRTAFGFAEPIMTLAAIYDSPDIEPIAMPVGLTQLSMEQDPAEN